MREMNFLDSSFFKEPSKSLPTPAQVRALSKDIHANPQPQPVIFEESKVFVKFGPYVTIAEAQCLWMIKRTFGDEIPVPEVFGWRVDEENYVFLYMELIQGQTLQDGWNELTSQDKSSLCDELCQIVNRLRRFEQDPSDQYIGTPRSKWEGYYLHLIECFQVPWGTSNSWIMFFNHTRKLGLSSPSRISTTGFPTYHNHGFLLRRNTTTPIGLCYRTVGSLNLLMATSTEGTSSSLPANQLESLLSWTGPKRDGIQTTGSTVRHSTLVGTRTSGGETGSTTF